MRFKKKIRKRTGTAARFRTLVLTAVKRIPKGETRSYKEIAALAGNPAAARAVGMIMAANTDRTVPCHRVIKSDGRAGGYNGLRGEKKRLLAAEGVTGNMVH